MNVSLWPYIGKASEAIWINQGKQRGGVDVKGLSVSQKRPESSQYNKR